MAQLTDPLALGFLTKATKGIKGMFTPDVLAQVAPLFGWSIRSHVVAAPLDGEQFSGVLKKLTPGVPGDHLFGSARERKSMRIFEPATGPAKVEAIRKHVVEVGKDGPAHPEPGRLYAHGLSAGMEVAYGHSSYMLGVDSVWYGMPGWTITTPKGSVTFTQKISYNGRPIPFSESAPDKVWSLLYKSGLKEDAKRVLDSVGHEAVERALRPAAFRELAGTGTCSWCFKNVKLLGGRGKVMRHGWSVSGRRQRGAYGLTWHTGPCGGFGWPPFEVSVEGTTAFRIYVMNALDRMKEGLAKLRSRPDQLLVGVESGTTKLTYVSKDTTKRVYSSARDSRGAPMYVSEYEVVLKDKIDEAEREIAAAKEEIEFLTQKIKTWKPQPLPGTR